MNAPTDAKRWVIITGVGGYVCAVPDERYADGICGMPVEDEPCPYHVAPAAGTGGGDQ
jgi:hypothetical protein